MKRYTFKKSERLCSKRYIKYLFAKGEKILVFPFSVYWCVCVNEDIPAPAQVMISVSKRKMKHAVDRNHTKRVIRECYRLHKENTERCLFCGSIITEERKKELDEIFNEELNLLLQKLNTLD